MNEGMGYKNAPNIKPQIGDIVQCGLPGGTAVVKSISITNPGTGIINCAFNGGLHLNKPNEAILVQTVEGVSYR